jgi:NADH dehydrogenase FAD-containing subunit
MSVVEHIRLQKVIVVGGGYGGTQAAMKLHNAGCRMDLTLVTTCTHMNINFGNVRAAVQPSFFHRVFAPYENMFHTTVHPTLPHPF